MADLPLIATDWTSFHVDVAGRLKELATTHWKLEPDGSGPDVHLALHSLFKAFPFPVDVVMLDTNGTDSGSSEGRLVTLFRYDVAQRNTLSTCFHGVIPLAALESHYPLLTTVFGFNEESLESLTKLSLTWMWGFPHFTQLVKYDPVAKLDHYATDLFHSMSMLNGLLEEFSPRLNFNDKYDLRPDHVLDEEAVLRVAELSTYFAPKNRSEALQRSQVWIAEIQLIPQVPGEVRHVFKLAKQLYVFGLFEYHFYTVSDHYAYLAVESALYHRWNAALKLPALIVHGKDTLSLDKTSRRALQTIFQERAWRPNAVKVNGRPYPHTASMTITQLREDGIINDWQLRRFKKVWMALRNTYSHLEFAPIDSPSTGTLARAAEQINTLFDSIKL